MINWNGNSMVDCDEDDDRDPDEVFEEKLRLADELYDRWRDDRLTGGDNE